MKLIDADLLMDNLGFDNTAEEREENVGIIITWEDVDRMPTVFDVEGKKLMEIYKLFNIDGSLKRKLTVKEMVMLYHIADVMRGGRDEE